LTALETLGERIAQLSAEIQAATYQLLVMLREFDDRSGWNSGFKSCAHWLNWRTGLDLGAAREKVRVARALALLPEISAAMAGRGLLLEGPRSFPRGDPSQRAGAARLRQGRHGGTRREAGAELEAHRSRHRAATGAPAPREPLPPGLYR
jgi:hypothetical protein